MIVYRARATRIALAVMMLLGWNSSVVGAAPKKTLPELLTLAQKHAALVAVAQAQLDVYKSQQTEAARLWAPKGELTYYLTGAPRVNCVGPKGYPGVDPNDPALRRANCVNTVDPRGGNVSFFSFNLGGPAMQLALNVVQPLYSFGKIENAKGAATHGVRAGEAGVTAARQEVEVQVIRAYWGIKAARASLEIVREGREELDPWVGKIDQDLESETPKYTESDLLRLKVSLSQLDVLISQLERGLTLAREGMATLVGEEVDVDDAEIEPAEIVEHPLNYYEAEAALARPELRQLNEGFLASHRAARARRAELLPDLAFIVGLNFRYAPSIEEAESAFVNHANQFGYSALLFLRQPLDIADRLARWKHARADAELVNARRRLASEGVRFDVARAHADLTEAQRRLKLTERGQKVAQGWLFSMRDNLSLGTATPRDLVEAARSYFELRIGYVQAIMDVNIAHAALRRAVGHE